MLRQDDLPPEEEEASWLGERSVQFGSIGLAVHTNRIPVIPAHAGGIDMPGIIDCKPGTPCKKHNWLSKWGGHGHPPGLTENPCMSLMHGFSTALSTVTRLQTGLFFTSHGAPRALQSQFDHATDAKDITDFDAHNAHANSSVYAGLD